MWNSFLNLFRNHRHERLLLRQLDVLADIRSLLHIIARPPRPTVPITHLATEEFFMGSEDLLQYQVTIGPVSHPSDVVKRSLTVAVDGVLRAPQDLDPFQLSNITLTVPEGAVVTLSVVDVDDAGLSSPPLNYTFTAMDTVPPTQPGGLSINPIGEIPGTPAVEEPAPTAPEPTGPPTDIQGPTANPDVGPSGEELEPLPELDEEPADDSEPTAGEE